MENNAQKRIDTSLIRNSTYKQGGVISDNSYAPSTSMKVDPTVYDRYDFALTEDIVLLNDRKDTNEKLYNIFFDSSWGKKYYQKNAILKINKEDIPKIFYYCKDELYKQKQISTFEFVIAVNEFFDFNYDYIYKNVMSVKMKADLYDDLYKLGHMANKDNQEEQLF